MVRVTLAINGSAVDFEGDKFINNDGVLTIGNGGRETAIVAEGEWVCAQLIEAPREQAN